MGSSGCKTGCCIIGIRAGDRDCHVGDTENTSSSVVREFGRQMHSITTEAHPTSSVSGKLSSVKPIRTKMKLNDIFPAIAGAATFMIDAAQAKKKKRENRTGSARRHCAKFIVRHT